MDCVNADGEYGIAYIAKISWMGLELYFSHLLLCKNSEKKSKSSLHRTSLPEINRSGFYYSNKLFSVSCNKTSADLKQELISLGKNNIEWTCHYPNVQIKIASSLGKVEGLGYIEELYTNIKPWRMKIERLFWGRFVSEQHSLVWIKWEGNWQRSYLWFDGKPIANFTIERHRIIFDDGEIEFETQTEIRTGSLRTGIFKKALALRRLFPFNILNSREQKWLSMSKLKLKTDTVVDGTSIFEIVDLRHE